MNRGYMALESVSVREFAKNMRDGQGGAINPGKGVYGAGTVSEGKGNQGSRERKAGIKKIIKV